jgi:S1-C subfamily serine protease
MLVLHIEPGSPAQRASLQEGDVIVGFAGEPVAGVDDLHRLLTEEQIGRPATLALIRRAEKRTVEIVPVESRQAPAA